MKKILVVVLVIALSMIGASAAFASIAGSKHDMTAAGTTGGFTGSNLSSCQYCHAPHNPTSQSVAPLWNRVTTNTVTQTYTFYATTTTSNTIGAQTKTCMTCHDGTSDVRAAIVNQNGNANSPLTGTGTVSAAGVISGDAAIGNLSNDHPVGVIFGDTGTYAGVATPSASVNGVGLVGVYRAYGATGSATVECSSCHDPHGMDYSSNDVSAPFLRGSIATICSDCHTTK